MLPLVEDVLDQDVLLQGGDLVLNVALRGGATCLQGSIDLGEEGCDQVFGVRSHSAT